MKLQFLGTAAAEGAPALFCACDFCRKARALGGRELRTRAGSLLDGRIKLDFGPDTYMQMLREGLDYSGIHSLLITHSHEDHLAVTELNWRWPVYAHVPKEDPPLTVYGNARVGEMIPESLLGERIAFQRLRPFETVTVEGYAVTPLQAVHCIDRRGEAGNEVVVGGEAISRVEEALFYLIEKDGKRLLYAHDTSWFTDDDWAFLKGKRLDIVSLDCTYGRLDGVHLGHMGAEDNLRVREELIRLGSADEETVFVANHFSHNGLAPYDEMQKRLPGFIVSYDGLTVEA